MKPSISELRGYLDSLSFFSNLPYEEVNFVHSAMEFVVHEQQDFIIQKGEQGDACYFIYDGHVEIVSQDLIGLETVLAQLGVGRIFGEVTLHRDTIRKTSVRAKSKVQLLKINHISFDKMSTISPHFFNQLVDFSLNRQKTTFIRLASIFARLPEDIIESLAQQSSYQQLPENKTIIKEGDYGHNFYMVISGNLQVSRNDIVVESLQKGDFFGEYGLLRSQQEPLTIRNLGRCELLVLPRESFHKVLENQTMLRTQFEEIIKIRNNETYHNDKNNIIPHSEMPLIEGGKKRKHWIITIAGTIFYSILAYACIKFENDILLVLAIIIGSFVGPIAFVNYVHVKNILGNQPYIIMLLFSLTALVGIPLAYQLEGLDYLTSNNTYASSLITALIEEPSKLLLVIWLIKRKRTRFLMDSVVYGAAAGMGFAAFECIIYGLNNMHDPGQALSVILFRALLTPFGHGTWTAIATAGIWQLYLNKRFLLCSVLIIIAIELHMVWNLQLISSKFHILQMLAVGVISLFLLRTIIRKGISDERKSIVFLNPELLKVQGSFTYMKCNNCLSELPFGSHYCPRCAQAMRVKE
ncbi:hypothetical protein Back11_43180 [Paenibacillus baekrokdamisoli]|uniref:Uncharacterized protein n=1 Tax=Paenibacillus baekrokdamisoli TaxID=1712516 RepID=A0A3G9JDB1_9BACL|nr:cyclic nucleotide-binding domain-containing protein [Paenibacillus baekrokdamisoli]MBB3067979.1 CRP-like cAMP-binding protein/RsiW-degrading membrane proteinase PrsW (M82 family) [Paenibacillus baekrokdamisoli]BBH22973.1 hypothetical protein Back11_43180 [Paenibacillus baekrokdamisoli]